MRTTGPDAAGERPLLLSGTGVLEELGRALGRLGMDEVVVVCRSQDAAGALGQVAGVLGSRVVAVVDDADDLPTPQAVFATADIAITSGADGVLALGHPGPAELVKALPLIVDLPTAVVSAVRSETPDDCWALSDRGVLTSGRHERVHLRLACEDPALSMAP
ncbi:iron-containing alcohol dehydrogenase [Bounagaea algeriensis]